MCDDESNSLGNPRLLISQEIFELHVDFQVGCRRQWNAMRERSAGKQRSDERTQKRLIVQAHPSASSFAIFSANAPIVAPGLTAPTVGITLPSATISPSVS